MTDEAKLAFQFARDFSTQLITLSTGVLALTITFTKEIIKTPAVNRSWILWVGWLLHIVSIIAGVFTTMAVIGHLMPTGGPPTIDQFLPNVRLFAGGQILTFVAGTVVIVIFGIVSLRARTTTPADLDSDVH